MWLVFGVMWQADSTVHYGVCLRLHPEWYNWFSEPSTGHWIGQVYRKIFLVSSSLITILYNNMWIVDKLHRLNYSRTINDCNHDLWSRYVGRWLEAICLPPSGVFRKPVVPVEVAKSFGAVAACSQGYQFVCFCAGHDSLTHIFVCLLTETDFYIFVWLTRALRTLWVMNNLTQWKPFQHEMRSLWYITLAVDKSIIP